MDGRNFPARFRNFPSSNVFRNVLDACMSPLHHAFYHGNLTDAVKLIKDKANVYALDSEKLSPLDVYLLTLPPPLLREVSVDASFADTSYDSTPVHQTTETLYTFGPNTNYVLGHDNAMEELSISPKQVYMGQYHSKRLLTRYYCG